MHGSCRFEREEMVASEDSYSRRVRASGLGMGDLMSEWELSVKEASKRMSNMVASSREFVGP